MLSLIQAMIKFVFRRVSWGISIKAIGDLGDYHIFYDKTKNSHKKYIFMMKSHFVIKDINQNDLL